MSTCKHENFRAQVDVNRLSKTEGGPITHYSADVRIKCAQCGTPFEFMGLPVGLNAYGVAVDLEGTELRAAIKPLNGPMPPAGLPGFSVRIGSPQ